MKNWVVLFARTGSEEKLVQAIKKRLDAEEYLPFVPTKEMPYRSKGVIYKERKPLFPGYVFVQTGIAAGLITEKLAKALRNVRDIYSILYDADFCVVGSVPQSPKEALTTNEPHLCYQKQRNKAHQRLENRSIVNSSTGLSIFGGDSCFFSGKINRHLY